MFILQSSKLTAEKKDLDKQRKEQDNLRKELIKEKKYIENQVSNNTRGLMLPWLSERDSY